MPIIKVRDAVKQFGPITAVNGVDLDVESGECFGLLGPNGAGKTSLVRMIIGSSPLTGGEIRVDGKNIVEKPREIKAVLGMVPQEENLDPDLNVLENLITFARYFGIPKDEAQQRALANLEFFGLLDKQSARIDELSGGMKRRLLIARGLINQPKLIILDEPTVGLDPQTKHLVWSKILSLKDQCITLLLTTQNMDEAWRLCDRVAVMNQGKVVAMGTPRELLERYGGTRVLEARPPAEMVSSIVSTLAANHHEWQRIEDTLYVFLKDGQALDGELREKMHVIDEHEPSLEDVFLRLTGRALRE